MIRVASLFPGQSQGHQGGDDDDRKRRRKNDDGPPGGPPYDPPGVGVDDDLSLSDLRAVLRSLLRKRAAGDLPKKARGKQSKEKAERKLDNFVSNTFTYRNPNPYLVQLRNAANQLAASRLEHTPQHQRQANLTPQAIVKEIVEEIQNEDDDDE